MLKLGDECFIYLRISIDKIKLKTGGKSLVGVGDSFSFSPFHPISPLTDSISFLFI